MEWSFIVAWMRLRNHENYEHTHFINNFKAHFGELEGRTGVKWIHYGLEDIFNHSKRGSKRIQTIRIRQTTELAY